MNPAWEAARKSIYPLPAGLRTEAVDLDFISPPAPCLACDDPAETAYRGYPFHILCTVELGFYVAAVKRGLVPMLPGLKGLFPTSPPRLAAYSQSTKRGSGGVRS